MIARPDRTQDDGTLRVGWILGKYNLADLFAKTTMTGNMRNGMVELIFCNKASVIREKYKK